MVGRDQRERDAEILAAAEQVLGIVQVEGEAEQRRDRRQRDVALVPGELDAERLLALVHVLGDDADVAHARCVRAGMRAGQREARDFLPRGEPRRDISPSARACRISRAARPARASWAP